MTKLYTDLARTYHEMYLSIFDYREEFQAYNRILKKERCKKILEIGCGSGNLSSYFLKEGYNYIGLDLHYEMLEIAREVESNANFIQGDMKNLDLKEKFDAILITGRTFTYLTDNRDVLSTLRSVYNTLNEKGILIFDNFNAFKIFSNFQSEMSTSIQYKTKFYKRDSKNTHNLKHGWTWNWDATYYITENNETIEIHDKTLLRAFTEDELRLFLKICKFKVKEVFRDPPSITILAQKEF